MAADEIIEVPVAPRSRSAGVARSMSGNRRRDTAPEMRLRSALHKRGWRFRVDMRVPVLSSDRPRPDLAFTRRRVAVFIDGCFWHGCPLHGTTPKSNSDYWIPKLARNRQRDRRNDEALSASGWIVVRIWEHEPVEDAVSAVEAALAYSDSLSALRSR